MPDSTGTPSDREEIAKDTEHMHGLGTDDDQISSDKTGRVVNLNDKIGIKDCVRQSCCGRNRRRANRPGRIAASTAGDPAHRGVEPDCCRVHSVAVKVVTDAGEAECRTRDESGVRVERVSDDDLRIRRCCGRGVLKPATNLHLILPGEQFLRQHQRRWGLRDGEVILVGCGRRDHFSSFAPADDDVIDVETFELVVLSSTGGIEVSGPVDRDNAKLVGNVCCKVRIVVRDIRVGDSSGGAEVEPELKVGLTDEVRKVNSGLPPLARVEQSLHALPCIGEVCESRVGLEIRDLGTSVAYRNPRTIQRRVVCRQQTPVDTTITGHEDSRTVVGRVFGIEKIVEVQSRAIILVDGSGGTGQIEGIRNQTAIRPGGQVVVVSDQSVTCQVTLKVVHQDAKLAVRFISQTATACTAGCALFESKAEACSPSDGRPRQIVGGIDSMPAFAASRRCGMPQIEIEWRERQTGRAVHTARGDNRIVRDAVVKNSNSCHHG